MVGVNVAVQFMLENGATPRRFDAKSLSLNINAGRVRCPTGNWPRPMALISDPLAAINTANGASGGVLNVMSFKTWASENRRRTCDAPVSAIAVTSLVGGERSREVAMAFNASSLGDGDDGLDVDSSSKTGMVGSARGWSLMWE